MKTPLIPVNDKERLAALHALLILDTPPEERFDRIVQFAASEFDMPIVLVSFVDENRQWFKARVGLDVCETPREQAFCAHAIHSTEPLLVPDTLKDERFFDHPLVIGAPHIRSYSGAPLVLPSGMIAGTLCLIDTKPHELDKMDLSILGTLRDLVVQELTEREQA
ncbi:MAG TPA: GAF domain-containing protein [Rhodocyclaceae bacterium]|nr:GAF domain-containing protein [Rhodocyclaceae bacterium]